MATLAEIEREVAARLGPFRQDTIASATSSTIAIAALRSSIERGDIRDAYLLRRGVKVDGSSVAVSSDDRLRIVKEYTPATGTLEVDRVYSVAPVANELVELHSLDPAQELRPAVLRGLARCHKEVEVDVELEGTGPLYDVTAELAWVTEPWQIHEVRYTSSGAPVAYFRPTLRGDGHVYLWLGINSPNALTLTARRPIDSFVEGAPVDSSVYPVDLAYAASAGHIECWRTCRPRLQTLAQTGLHPSQEECAKEFTAQARHHYKGEVRRQQLGEAI